jgi:hypothetical protein
MLSRLLAVVVAIFLLATAAGAETFEGQCDFRFYGRSTLHKFDGKGVCQPFILISERTEQGQERVSSPVIEVLVKWMDTDNSGRDNKMYAMFESDRYPEIKSKFNDLFIEEILLQLREEGNLPGHLDFDLQIRDVTKPVKAAIHQLSVTPEQVTFQMEFPLSLTDFGLEPPSVLGLIRVDDQVRVEVTVALSRH